MSVTPETLALAAQIKAAVGAEVDRYTYQLIQAWAEAWDDLAAAFDAEFEKLRKLGVWADGMDAERIHQLQRSLSTIVDQRLTDLIDETGAQVGATTRQIANATIANTAAVIASQVPPSHWPGFIRPVPQATLDWVAHRATQQITVRNYILQADATAAMKRELFLSLAAGDNPNDAAERMVARVEDAFNGGLTRATVIARTEMLDAHRAAALEQRKANADILKGWMWQADLSERTCPSCWAMHGTTYPLDEPGPIDHHQGRCTAIPVTRSWKELGIDGVDEPEGIYPSRAEASDKFERLPEAKQREILGPARYEAWKSGVYPMNSWPERRSHYETVDGVTRRAWRDSIHTSKAPAKPSDGWKWEAPSANRALTPGEAAHFKARQDRLPFEFNGEVLKPHEVVFCERFDRRHERVEWMPQRMREGRREKTPDFRWSSQDGLLYELKSSKAKYSTIANAIREDVEKQRFVVDIGRKSLSPKLASDLASYNIRNPNNRIEALWVLSGDGSDLRRLI